MMHFVGVHILYHCWKWFFDGTVKFDFSYLRNESYLQLSTSRNDQNNLQTIRTPIVEETGRKKTFAWVRILQPPRAVPLHVVLYQRRKSKDLSKEVVL